MSYFPVYSHNNNKTEVKLDFPNSTKFAKIDDSANLKWEVDKVDIDKLAELGADKLKPALTDLSKLSDRVKNDVVGKKDYNAKIKNILRIEHLVLLT